MSRKVVALVVWLALVLLGAAGWAQERLVAWEATPTAKGTVGCAPLSVRGAGLAGGTGVFADGFESGDLSAWAAPVVLRVTELVDVVIEAPLPDGWTGDTEIAVELLTPAGSLYESKVIAVSSTATRATSRRIRDYPHPVAVQRVGAASPTATFPVAGTSIVASGLYGMWTARARLRSGDSTPCWEPASFELRP
jgi:hypothetical protein